MTTTIELKKLIKCPIVCMFHSQHTNNKMNKLHERAFRIVYDNDISTFY